MTILDKIVAHKKKEYAKIAETKTLSDLEKSELFQKKTVSLSQSLLNENKTGIIAEYKRKSPSKGIINSSAMVVEVTSGYFREGASGVSVLTDNKYFGGSPLDLSLARSNKYLPILRKDFIISEYQIIESKAIGADVILLIAAVLDKTGLLNLARLASSIGLEVLVEIHEQEELELINQFVNIIGVNNRNLKTFEVNTDISFTLADKIPSDFIKISESGISSTEIIKELRLSGYNGFLIGEKFMLSDDPVRAFSLFTKGLI
jgi:indole-3-glycerol phosphate synthase